MDISGQVHAVLQKFASAADADRSAYGLLMRAALQPGMRLEPPEWEAIAEKISGRGVESLFQQASLLRLASHLEPNAAAMASRALLERLCTKRDTPLSAADALWHHWVLLLAEKRGVHVDALAPTGLWKRAFEQQTEAGHIHHLNPDTLLDGFVFDELTAIHAAYNSARSANDARMLDQVRRAVNWHVEHTQPDNTTNAPWGLAAFTALDRTGTFAEQQLHDTITWLANTSPRTPGSGGRVPLAVALLADALMTLENR